MGIVTHKKKCLFDMSDLVFEKTYYSINLYKYRILDNISQDKYDSIVLLVSEENAGQLKQKYPQFGQVVYKPLKRMRFHPSLIYYAFERLHFRRFVNQTGYDCFFTATNIDYKLTAKLNLRKVVVIHDIKSIWEVSGLNRIRVKNYYRDLINNSNIAIAISKFTKDHILDSIPGVQQKKLRVVYNSVVVADKSVAINDVNDIRYILYVNTLDVYKNIITLIKAYIRTPEHNNYKLVVVAKRNDYWNEVIMPLLARNGIQERVILLSGVEEGVLKYLYENAALFVSPSLNEGFGYTPIEAAICHCPVLCTKCEALPDTTRGLLNYYDNPMDDKELSEKIEKLISSRTDERTLESISRTYREEYCPEKQIAGIWGLLELK